MDTVLILARRWPKRGIEGHLLCIADTSNLEARDPKPEYLYGKGGGVHNSLGCVHKRETSSRLNKDCIKRKTLPKGVQAELLGISPPKYTNVRLKLLETWLCLEGVSYNIWNEVPLI